MKTLSQRIEAVAADGIGSENKRLSPLIKALGLVVRCVEMWSEQVDTHGGDYLPEHRQAFLAAMTNLEAVLAEMEGE